MTEGDYVDLSLNPERFTGYAGISASRVWTAIYEENCFGQSESELSLMRDPKKSEEGTQTIPETMTDLLPGEEEGAQCLEKRVYYKIVSGLHASISTHICYEHFNQTTGQWGPNLPCFVNRVASHPERLQYIYFNTVLLLRAVARIGPYLQAYDYCSSGTHEEDAETMRMLGKVIGIAGDVGKFDETVLFRGENANVLKEEFKAHFRNVTRIMDCVGCDKCRLWGKVQTTGVATALKILFELDEKALDPHTNSNLLQRTEVVALINTLHRFSESLAAVEEFRKLWREASAADSEKLIRDAEDAAKRPRPSPPVGASVETESYDAMGDVGEDPRWDKFADFHDYLAKAFPLTHANTKLTKVHTYGLVYHWQGSDSSLKPALLTAHQDVVPVHPDTVDEWVHPPYSGYYDGEYVWGRGSLDDKSGLVGLLSSTEVLLEHSFRPVRTIVFAFGFDEESGPVHSAGHLNDYLLATYGKDGFSILVDEGGGWGESYGSDMTSVGIGEKGSISVKLQVASPGGHSSVPPPHTSIGILAALLVTYEDNPFPVQLARDTPIYETVQCLAMHSKSIDSTLRKFIKESTASDKALKKASELLAENIKMKSLISTTQAINIVNGGVKTNALPEQAYAIVNHRVATDSSIAATQKRDTDLLIPLAERFNLSFTAFGSLISEADVPAYGTLALTGGGIDPAPVSPIDAGPFKVLSGSIRAAYNTHRGIEDGGPEDELVVSPGITTGNTDTRYYWDLTRHIFRYAHMYNGNATAGIRTGVHTTNEAVRAVDFVESIRYYTALIMNLNEATDL